MHQAWIVDRHSLSGVAHRLEDDAGVLPREALGAVREAGAVVSAARAACARRVRAARRRQQAQARQSRAALEAAMDGAREAAYRAVIEDAQALLQSLHQERAELRRDVEQFICGLARAALPRLLLTVPDDWPAQSSLALVLADWSQLRAEDVAVAHLHPADLALLPPPAADAGWTLRADPSMERGSCLLVHAAGTVRTSFRANVDVLCERLAAAVEAARAPDGEAAFARDPSPDESGEGPHLDPTAPLIPHPLA